MTDPALQGVPTGAGVEEPVHGVRVPGVLRFAVAMRGGVSLAVWIGGACFEIDRLRRNDDAFVHALLDITRFREVEVDILTGASAGGLNAALAGLAIARDVPPRLRNTWIGTADIDKLLAWDSRAASTPKKKRRSVLNGDYFREEVIKQLETTQPEPAEPEQEKTARRTGPMQLFLAATVMGGVPVVEPDDPEFVDQRHEAYFHFRHLADDPAFSDLDDPAIAVSLGHAARATASFPVAFEPEPVHPRDFVGRLNLPTANDKPETIRLYDGGVVDNIPVARAIRAAAASPAIETVRRCVLFLHPSPTVARESDAQVSEAAGSGVPTVASVVADVVASKVTETLLDDLDVLRLHNRDAEAQAIQRYSACAAALADTGAGSADDRLASADADWLYSLLDSPVSVLPWIPIGTEAPPSPLRAATDGQRYHERIGLLERLVARDATVRPYARLARLAHLTIDWIRRVEDGGAPGLIDCRRTAYDVLFVAELIEAALDHAFVCAAPGFRVDELESALGAAERSPALHTLVAAVGAHRSAEDSDPLVERLPDGARQTLVRLAKGELPGHAGSPASRDASQVLLDRLAGIGVELLAACGPAADADPSMWTLLAGALGPRPAEADVVQALVTVDAACAGLHRGRVIGFPQALDYVRISGAQGTPLAGDSFADRQLPKLASLTVVEGGLIDPQTKLAGDRLANFAAFLSSRFRANDWMWGRMDAAAGLVGVMLRPGSMSCNPTDLLVRVGGVVKAAFPVSAKAPALSRSAEMVCADLWEAYEDKVRGELIAAAGAPTHADGPAASLETIRALVTVRWQLGLFVEEVVEVLHEPLDGGSGDDLPSMSEPRDVRTARKNLQDAMDVYDRIPRHAADLWGSRRSAALGVRVAEHVARAVVDSAPLQSLLAAPLMTLAGALLLRGAFLISWALLINILLVPRLVLVGRVAVVVVSAALQLGYWRVCCQRGRLRALLSGATALAASAFGVMTWWIESPPFGPPPRVEGAASPLAVLRAGGTDLWRSVIAVSVATAVAGFLLWLFAKWRWKVGLPLLAGLMVGWWDVVGSWTPPPTYGSWLLRLQATFGSMWVPTFLIASIATAVAMFLNPEDRRPF